MNSPAIGLRVASVIFGLVALGQLTRLLLQLEVIIAGRHVPLWPSAVVLLVAAGLCAWLWKLSVPAPTNPAVSTPGSTVAAP